MYLTRFILRVSQLSESLRMRCFGVEDPPPTLSDKILGGLSSYPNMVRRLRFLVVLIVVALLAALIIRVT